jgi:hypothetical protein
MSQPELSVVVCAYNMAREVPRTLHSLSAIYQRDIAADDYEVIVVDNGSTPPLDPAVLDGLVGDFRLIRIDDASPSPVRAVNRGLAEARGEVVGVMIDGARLATPGLLHFARQGVRLYPRAVVASLGWYLGLDQQRWAIDSGYDRQREDALLASIDWPTDGYRLYEIGALDESSIDGWFGGLNESNALFMARDAWTVLGGYDERFDASGGGFANLDVLIRALALADARLVVLLGDGTFHQLHGGVATNTRPQAIGESVAAWAAQYESIAGRPWAPPNPAERSYLGVLPRACLRHVARAVLEPVESRPLGDQFDRGLWTLAQPPAPADGRAAAVTDLAWSELSARRFANAAAIARIARRCAPDEPAPQQITAIAGPWLRGAGNPPPGAEASFFRALGDANRILGDAASAADAYARALAFDPDHVDAHLGLSHLRMPGEHYAVWLARLHERIRPRAYLEIGVAKGRTLALAQPPTRAIGVDPEPNPDASFRTETHLFCETSDAFFARSDVKSIIGEGNLDLAFIDGLHHFQQALRDFINVEALGHPRSVVAFHDTYPLDEVTQRPERQRRFYSGDVWKAIWCLRRLRPDLSISTLATPWTGLTIVTGLDPASRVLADRFDEVIAEAAALDFAEMEARLPEVLGLASNGVASFEASLARALPLSGVDPSKSAGSTDLYLDLLIRTLANTIYEDVSMHPKQDRRYRWDLRREGADWPQAAHTMVGVRRLENLADLMRRALTEGVPGDFIETGVWRGGCCILMRGVLAATGVLDRKVFVADSFEGLPPPNPEAFPKDESLHLEGIAELAVSLEQVKANFERYGLLDDQVVFVKGWFSQTLPVLEAGPFALIRLDGDLYESTYLALETLYPKVSKGGFVIIDDYGAVPQCREAVADYRALHGIDAPIHTIDWTGAWWRKP